MQYTYEEAVRELSDFLGKHVTADNYWKMGQVSITVLKGDEERMKIEYDAGWDAAMDYVFIQSEDDPYSMNLDTLVMSAAHKFGASFVEDSGLFEQQSIKCWDLIIEGDEDYLNLLEKYHNGELD